MIQEKLSLSNLVPSIITIFGLCAGLTSIKFTFLGKWEIAMIFILIGITLDGFDGRIARLLNSASNFGAQLDSLADAITCGIAPGILLYSWYFSQIKIFGWYVVVIYIICIIIRLARFNVNTDKDENEKKNFFVGLAAPSGAVFVMIPLMLSMSEFPIILQNIFINNVIAITYILTVSFLTISYIKTPSLKDIKIPRYLISLFLLCAAIIIFAIFIRPWQTIPVLALVYLALIIYYNSASLIIKYCKTKKSKL